MNHTLLRATLVLLTSGLYYGASVKVDRVNGLVGHSVTFNTKLEPTNVPFMVVAWAFNETTPIITSTIVNITAPQYKERITLERSTGSLELRNLTMRDSGEYEVSIIPQAGQQIKRMAVLKVFSKVQKPTINCPTANLTEDKTSVNLTCNVDDTISAREWLKDGKQLVSGGRITFFEDNRVLSISPVDRTDNEEFVCVVANPASHETAKCSFTVNYGPDKPTIIQEPETATYGKRATLTCSADSLPKATFTWTFKDEKTTGSVYDISKVEDRHLGSYTCTAHNAVTGLEVSEVHALKGSAVPLSGATSFMIAAALTLLGLLLQ